MPKFKIRRETAKEITSIAGVLAYISGFLYTIVGQEPATLAGADFDSTFFGVVGGVIASLFGASGVQHVAREAVRKRNAKPDADADYDAGPPDGDRQG